RLVIRAPHPAPGLAAATNGRDGGVEPHDPRRQLSGESPLAERERLKGKVQCIYFDPPYGIRFNSNWQVSTRSRQVDSKQSDITREPEQVEAFRDTWKDGIHSYLT